MNTELDNEGFFVYERPQDKSGGHGVGWTEIPRYSFRIPPGWEEMPVSIADPGGAEVTRSHFLNLLQRDARRSTFDSETKPKET